MQSQFAIKEWLLCSVFTTVLWLSIAFQTLGHLFLFFIFSQGLYDQALEDCEKALQLNEGNYRALYRKAKSLKELGRHQEAYEAVAKCSLAVPQVRSLTVSVCFMLMYPNMQERHALFFFGCCKQIL